MRVLTVNTPPMVTTHPPRRARHGSTASLLVAAALLALLASLASPLAVLAIHTVGHGSEPGTSGPAIDEASPEQLRAMVSELTDQRDDLARSLERFEDLYAPLEADRQLLVELAEEFEIPLEELNLDLGPLGRLL